MLRRKPWLFLFLALLLLQVSCSTHYMTPDSLIEQLQENPTHANMYMMDKEGNLVVVNDRGSWPMREGFIGKQKVAELLQTQDIVNSYRFSHKSKVLVTNKKQELCRLGVDQNSQIIINKGLPRKYQSYLTSTWLIGDEIMGYRSRLMGFGYKMKVADIQTVEIYSEFKVARKVK